MQKRRLYKVSNLIRLETLYKPKIVELHKSMKILFLVIQVNSSYLLNICYWQPLYYENLFVFYLSVQLYLGEKVKRRLYKVSNLIRLETLYNHFTTKTTSLHLI